MGWIRQMLHKCQHCRFLWKITESWSLCSWSPKILLSFPRLLSHLLPVQPLQRLSFIHSMKWKMIMVIISWLWPCRNTQVWSAPNAELSDWINHCMFYTYRVTTFAEYTLIKPEAEYCSLHKVIVLAMFNNITH